MECLIFKTLCLIITCPLLCGIFLWLSTRKYRHIPGNLGSPIIGNLQKMFESYIHHSPNDLYNRVSQLMEMHGKTVTLWFGPVISIATKDPAVVEKLCLNPAAKNKEHLIYNRIKEEFSVGLFSTSITDSSECKWYLKSYGKSLTMNKIGKYHEVFTRRTSKLINVLDEQKGEFDISPFVFLTTVGILLETHCGLNHDYLEEQYFYLYNVLESSKVVITNTVTNPIEFLLPKCMRNNSLPDRGESFFDKILNEIMNNLKEGTNQDESSLANILVLKDLMEKKSLKHMKFEIKEIFTAGSLTTSEVITSVLFFLAMYPEVQEKVWKEQQEIFTNSYSTPTLADIKEMVYLDKVLKETIRLTATPLTSRRLTEEIRIGTLRLPKNSTVLICINHIMMNPEYFPNPKKFNPDHFLPENVSARPKSISLFFGLAPRSCPGAEYGKHLSKVAISTIVRNFKLSTTRRPEDIQYCPNILMQIEGPIIISIERRPR